MLWPGIRGGAGGEKVEKKNLHSQQSSGTKKMFKTREKRNEWIRERERRVFIKSEDEKEKVSLDLISINFKSHFSLSTFFVVFSFLLFEWALTFSCLFSLLSFVFFSLQIVTCTLHFILLVSFILELTTSFKRGPEMRWMALFSNDGLSNCLE